ncbi:calcium-dependent protein kinase 11-like protein [Tanacetum coccineum]
MSNMPGLYAQAPSLVEKIAGDDKQKVPVALHMNKIEQEANLLTALCSFDEHGSGYITKNELQEAGNNFLTDCAPREGSIDKVGDSSVDVHIVRLLSVSSSRDSSCSDIFTWFFRLCSHKRVVSNTFLLRSHKTDSTSATTHVKSNTYVLGGAFLKAMLKVWNAENLQCLQTSTDNTSFVTSILC